MFFALFSFNIFTGNADKITNTQNYSTIEEIVKSSLVLKL